MAGDTSIDMMINVLPGTLTGFFALNAGLSSINQQFQNMTKSVDNHFGIVDATITSAAVLLTQFSKNAADAFGQYEQGMKIVQVVSGQTSASIQELGQKANEFSVQYRMDIDELTTGLQTLGRAGLKSASEQTEVLENGLQTAKLEGRDLNTVLEELLQNTTLLGGNLKSSNFGEQSQYVNDLLVATSMTAPINTHDISETLKYSGGIAAAAGANIESDEGKEVLEDYMASIAAFAQKGVKGSIAGTALRAFFNKPATQDSSVLEGLSMIGLKPEYLWEDGGERMKPVSQQIALIKSQMEKKNISQMDQLQIWSKIVGGKMGQQMMKLDAKDIKEITGDIREANSAEKMATESMRTYESAMKQAGEAGQLAFRSYGEHAARFLKPIAEILTPILQAMSNPAVSTVFFNTFIALLGRAWLSVQKIFTAVKSEIGMIKSLMSSTILNQPTRKGLIGDVPWGAPNVEKQREQAQIVDSIALKTKEIGAEAKLNSTAIVAKLEDIRRIMAAVGNKIKEILEEIQVFFNRGIGKFMSQFEAAITKSSSKLKTEFQTVSNEVINSSKVKFDRNIASSAAKMRTELQAALNSINYTPKIKQLATGKAVNNVGKVVDSESPSYMFLANTKRKLNQANNQYQKAFTDLEKRRANVTLTRDIGYDKKSAEKKLKSSTKQREGIKGKLSSVNKEINSIKSSIGNFRYLTQEELKIKQEELKEKMPVLREQQVLLSEELTYKKEEVNLHRGIVHTLGILLEELKAERVSLVTGKGSTGPTFKSGEKMMPGAFPGYNNIPKQYQPNYSVSEDKVRTNFGPSGYGYYTSKSSMPGVPGNIPWHMIPKEYRPNIAPLQENWTNKRKEQKENIDKTRIENEKAAKQEAKAKNRNAINTAKLAEENKRLSNGLKNYNVGTMMSRMFGGDYNAAQMKKMALDNLGISATTYPGTERYGAYGKLFKGAEASEINKLIASKSPAELVPFFQALEAALNMNTAALERNVGATMYGQSHAANTFAPSVLEEREARYQENLRRKTSFGYKTGGFFDSSTRTFNSGNSSGYIPGGASALQEHGSHLNETVKVTKDHKNAMAYMFGEMNKEQTEAYNKSINQAKENTLRAQNESFTGKQKRNLREWGRSNGLISLSTGKLNKNLSSVTKGLKGLTGSALKATNIIGGPFFAGMMAFDLIMQAFNSAQQAYTKKIEEATQKLDDMVQKQSEAEDLFYSGKHEKGEREIQGWDDEHPDATYEEREGALLEAYEKIYDNPESLSALDENTQQLAIATEEVKRATDAHIAEYYDGSFFAPNGTWGQFWSRISQSGNVSSPLVKASDSGVVNDEASKNLNAYVDKRGTIFESSSPTAGNYFRTGDVVLDKSWQEGENYPWLKEFAPILSADIWKQGTTEQGLKTMLGSSGYGKVDDIMNSTGGWDNSAFTRHGYNISKMFSSERDQNRLQMGLKNYGPDFTKLAKQTRRFEKATGATALQSYNKELKKTKNVKKALENLKVTDPKLVSYIKSLSIKTGMDAQQVLMAAQLQQLQEMHTIAKDQVSPRMESLVGMSYQQVAYGGQTLSTVMGSGSGAVSAAQNAAAIARLLNAVLEEKLDEQNYQDYLSHIDENRMDERKYKNPQELAAAVNKAHNDGKDTWLDQYYDKKMIAYAATNSQLWNPNMNTEDATKRAEEWYAGVKDAKSWSLYDTLRKGSIGALTQNILAAYDAGLDSEESNGSGGSGGSGSGSGSDKDKGTRRERVDLVLCNKKEIPKLNVNLFKKPPTFTVLNKNFKVRDVKINTEDTPKAIMSSIKNAFIDVQKRSDPKIIQDESAEYDPVAATDGNNLPSGTSKPNTS